MNTVIPTRDTAVKIVELLKHGLVRGLGFQIPGEMCVEAVVCHALGLPHGDNPPCVSRAVREFKIRLNDAGWSSNKARADGLERLAIAQLGSDQINDVLFANEVVMAAVRKIVPIALREAAKFNPSYSTELERHASLCETASDLIAARAAAYDAASAAYAASAANATSAAYAAATSAAYASAAYAAADYASAAYASADSAASAAASSASASAAYAASASASAAYAAASADKVLTIMADAAVDALIKCKSPGCKWLDLVTK